MEHANERDEDDEVDFEVGTSSAAEPKRAAKSILRKSASASSEVGAGSTGSDRMKQKKSVKMSFKKSGSALDKDANGESVAVL